MIRVRFAPSPTGYLHVGGARTALFNWLFARHLNGAFILRIEDTDQERSTEESIEQILEAMRWLGLDWDEYYRQTARSNVHQQVAQELVDRGCAYMHEGAWWFRVPKEGETIVHDELLGDVSFQNAQLKDFVIRRSDGSFVYNFVVVVDDADMRITHVIRGDDHLNNTPKQILIYEALERPLPHFAHLPLILGPDRTRLSKRHGVTSVLEYRRRGFLSETIVNFLARLGWSHGDQEFFTRDDLIELFSLENVGSSAAIFDEAKLFWLNQQHMKAANPEELLQLVKPFVLEKGQVTQAMWEKAGPERLSHGVTLLRHRAKTLPDLAEMMSLLFPIPLTIEESVTLSKKQKPLIQAVLDALARVPEFTPEVLEECLSNALSERGAKLKEIAPAIRMVVTGRRVGPGLFELLSLVGRELIVARLRDLLK
ncbi:glutamate--tRNA ligase [Candidatus Bipolaricaulota bacterium]|nr:glutamate--tRNA ligase [Candidatus Bipolaricaulota bacterium]